MKKNAYARAATLFSIAAAIVMIAGCVGYVPGRQAYWDSKVKEMCDKDGGVTVFETVQLGTQDHRNIDEILDVLPRDKDSMLASRKPYYLQVTQSTIRQSNPVVMRGKTEIYRRSDSKLLGRSVRYWRTGGDFPTGLSQGTHYICPANSKLVERVFTVQGGGK